MKKGQIKIPKNVEIKGRKTSVSIVDPYVVPIEVATYRNGIILQMFLTQFSKCFQNIFQYFFFQHFVFHFLK